VSTDERTTVTAAATPEVVAGPATARRSGRHRRPSGAPPPLPRNLGSTGKGLLVALAAMLIWIVVAAVSPVARRGTDRLDVFFLRLIAHLRTPWLTSVFRAIDRFGLGWLVTIASLALIVALIILRRWRHLFTFLGSVFVLELVGHALLDGFRRPRPYDITILDRWKGFSLPSPPVAVVTILIAGVIYTLVVAGPARTRAKVVGVVLVTIYSFARLYLAVDHPFDVMVAIALAAAIPVNAFRFFTPNEVFPVTYRKGKTAHLDVTGARGEAIRHALLDQLGLTVLELKPVGLAGSGGSTPLRIKVAGDPDQYMFGKLYAMSHVRADRWYKVGRTVLYGRLEDEAPFQSVRRLVEYEDYALRIVRDAGIHTATPYGIVEMTPEREYLLVTEFFDGAKEIGDVDVDDHLIDQGLLLVRKLWDAGLAHRDIKPANLLVRDGELLLIDVAFAQVRPSPWRQAIDLANMMMVLAVRSDSRRVYDRALRMFTPEEIAEAFAATRGVASPSQLRAMMKQSGRDLMAEFRALAPPRRRISLQRWSVKRVALAAIIVIGAVLATQAVIGLFVPLELEDAGSATCGTSNSMILMAQSVPTATSVPCVGSLPAGWQQGGLKVKRGRSTFWLGFNPAGSHAVEVTLLPPGGCATDQAVEVPSDKEGMRRFERPETLPPHLHTVRTYVFEGGCVTYDYALGPKADPALIFTADRALDFTRRSRLVDKVAARTHGLSLCGAEAPPCEDGR
jgi:tRNA A-37 threonylcarbamoyl transferase component Bud32